MIKAPLFALSLAVLLPGAVPVQDADVMEDAQAAFARVAAIVQPGEHHALLERFVGTWKTTTKFNMGAWTAGEPGTAVVDWLMPGRWLRTEAQGQLMGQPFQSFSIMGYDNMKRSYVVCVVGSADTAMLTSEGDATPDGKALITYGTLDEYLTGEHDKMVKYVWRFVADDKLVFEVHDLNLGETDTKVVETVYTRSSSS